MGVDGSIITFYSFKGGVGRTMALANVATLLAQRGRRVLVVDWDLEAPGLHRYFDGGRGDAPHEGLMDVLSNAFTTSGRCEWQQRVQRVRVGEATLDLLAAGSGGNDYARQLEHFDWDAFFERRDGGAFIERLRSEWSTAYEVTLIDSRTGYTDSGGVCTIQLPDVLVAVFTANDQSLEGVREAIAKAQAGRQRLAVPRMPLLVVPLPSRFDGRTEVAEARRWTGRFADELAVYYDDWLPKGTSYRRVVERMRVPHVAYYTFGEKLPVLEESVTDPEGMSYAYDAVASLIDNRFEDAASVLVGGRAGEASAHVGAELQELTAELEKRLEGQIARQWMLMVLGLVGAFALAVGLSYSAGPLTGWAELATLVVLAVGGAVAGNLTADTAQRVRDLRRARDELRAVRTLDPEEHGRQRLAYNDALAVLNRGQTHDEGSPPRSV